MNSLGQIRALLEWQSLQNFSGQQSNSGMPVSSSFASLLQEFVQSQNQVSSIGQAENGLNTLGQVFQNSQYHIQQYLTDKGDASNIYGTSSTEVKQDSPVEQVINRAAETYRLPSKLIKAVIRHESNFNTRAVSRTGAAGLMQLMPATARGLGVTDIMDPEQNVMAGAKYLRNMLDKYKGNVKLALAAYNAGPGNVDKYGGIPPFKETQNYVRKVTDTYLG
ncbi:lytic transglycosylase domain-containing protein [Siminovitchia fortis]|uniref:Lytic transglycosylase domain-containing protein n=1 Tax=Siminovitchia fortis TaxID=254758 RepID=A0A443IL10_9BACI|nr:lytic transglycosylase domain-containing protein [Siminovitchia fortis]RWR05555.1 lytic transglycosylase domain-containing protein [Siminovitchia fortis]WHY83553.1 lytic transglycosylase domain-containing protein [Siminovitchia fortis]